jgi:hypothetical protein
MRLNQMPASIIFVTSEFLAFVKGISFAGNQMLSGIPRGLQSRVEVHP